MAKDKKDSSQEFISEVEQDQQKDGDNPIITDASLAAQTLASNEVIADELSARDKSADISLKWVYGIAMLVILLGWEIFVIYFSCKQLNPDSQQVRHVSDGIMIAMWSSATANIVALPAIILKYLFPNRH